MNDLRFHRRSLREGIGAGLVCLVIALGSLAIVYHEAEKALTGNVRARLENLASAGAGEMEAVLHATITRPEQMGSADYRSALAPLLRLRGSVPEIFYAYTMVMRDGRVVFVLDTSYYIKNAGDETAVAKTGEEYGEASTELRDVWKTGRVVSSAEPYTDKWGTFLSGYAPFKNAAGEVAGVVGVDLSMRDFQARMRPLQWSLGAAAALSVLGAAGAGFARYRANMRRSQAEEQLLRSRSEAEAAAAKAGEADRAKSVFLATMSHEIRTPMNGVLGTAELLADTPLDAEQRGHLETIRQSGAALLTVLNDILDYSKIEAGALSMHADAVDLRACLEEVAALFQGQARQKGVELQVWPSDGAPGATMTDAGRLRQILTNLVSNAVKFTEHGSVRLRIEAARLGDKPGVALVVADTGAGIPANRLGLLFMPFSQVDDSSTRRQGGTGLGLAISRRLAELMGGQLTVASAPGEGSRFRLVLPLVETVVAPESKPAPVAADEVPAKTTPLRLLVAEDIHNNRRVVDLLLKRLGHTAAFAADGTEAVRRWRELKPDVILMDVQMPKLDGREATRAIRAECGDGRRPWIIALTAGALAEEREAALAAGMNDFITKPLTGAMLAGALRRAQDELAC